LVVVCGQLKASISKDSIHLINIRTFQRYWKIYPKREKYQQIHLTKQNSKV